MIKEVWCELKGLPKPVFADVWEGPIEPRIEELKKQMRDFEEKSRKEKEEWDKQQAAKPSQDPSSASKPKTKQKAQKFEELSPDAKGAKVLRYNPKTASSEKK